MVYLLHTDTGLLAFLWNLWDNMPRLLEDDNDNANDTTADAASDGAESDTSAEGGDSNVEDGDIVCDDVVCSYCLVQNYLHKWKIGIFLFLK